MSATIRDAESAYLEARSLVETWRVEFLQQWLQPELDVALIQFWQTMDPAMKQILQMTQPAAYNELDQQVELVKERLINGTSDR